MSKHTKGSWKVDGKTELCITDVDDISRFIGSASIMGSNNNYKEAYEEAKANAILMAAAPEMLQALEIIYEHWNNEDNAYYGMDGELFPIMKTVKQAIAKAKGEV